MVPKEQYAHLYQLAVAVGKHGYSLKPEHAEMLKELMAKLGNGFKNNLFQSSTETLQVYRLALILRYELCDIPNPRDEQTDSNLLEIEEYALVILGDTFGYTWDKIFDSVPELYNY